MSGGGWCHVAIVEEYRERHSGQRRRGREIDGHRIDDLSEIPGSVRALKKPIAVTACRIDGVLTVETAEGTMSGKPGDWLMMQGMRGEMSICPNDVFRNTYDIVTE